MSTKDKIIEALATCIKHNESVQDISISKIAEIAEIGKSTVYEHFKSKDELIFESYKYLAEYYTKRILAPIKEDTFEKAYKELIKRLMVYAQEANDLMMGILSEGQGIKMLAKNKMKLIVNRIQEEVADRYLEIIHMGVKEKIIRPDLTATKEKGHVVKALTIGLIMQRINEDVDLSETEALQYLYKYTVIALNA